MQHGVSFFFPEKTKKSFIIFRVPVNSRNRSISFASPLHLLIMKIPVKQKKTKQKKITTSVVCAWVCVSVRGIPRLVFYILNSIKIFFLVNLTKGALETGQRFKLLAPFSPRPPLYFWLAVFFSKNDVSLLFRFKQKKRKLVNFWLGRWKKVHSSY